MSDIEMRPDVSQKMTQAINNKYHNNNISYGLFQKPEFFVFIYSVSNKTFEIRRPPQIPLLVLKACPADKDYIQVAKLADPFLQTDRNVDTGMVVTFSHPAAQIAQDIVCPDAPNMDAAVSPGSASSGTDLRAQGIFWSLNNPPTPEEVAKANKRVETYYLDLLERAKVLEYQNPKELMERINEDYHLAADYAAANFEGDWDFSWHRTKVRKVKSTGKVDCPYCGEQIKPGVAFHKGEDGDLCILDWKRAYEAGKVTLKQVPDEKRWDIKAPVTESH